MNKQIELTQDEIETIIYALHNRIDFAKSLKKEYAKYVNYEECTNKCFNLIRKLQQS